MPHQSSCNRRLLAFLLWPLALNAAEQTNSAQHMDHVGSKTASFRNSQRWGLPPPAFLQEQQSRITVGSPHADTSVDDAAIVKKPNPKPLWDHERLPAEAQKINEGNLAALKSPESRTATYDAGWEKTGLTRDQRIELKIRQHEGEQHGGKALDDRALDWYRYGAKRLGSDHQFLQHLEGLKSRTYRNAPFRWTDDTSKLLPNSTARAPVRMRDRESFVSQAIDAIEMDPSWQKHDAELRQAHRAEEREAKHRLKTAYDEEEERYARAQALASQQQQQHRAGFNLLSQKLQPKSHQAKQDRAVAQARREHETRRAEAYWTHMHPLHSRHENEVQQDKERWVAAWQYRHSRQKLYDILGAKPSLSVEALRKARNMAILQHHPSRYPASQKPEQAKKLQTAVEAFDKLSAGNTYNSEQSSAALLQRHMKQRSLYGHGLRSMSATG